MRARLRDRAVSKAPRFNLTACAIFREEAPFLAEWIRFHQSVGFEHFYLYNNFSTDDFKAVLEPFIQEGLVTLVDWPRPVGQLSAYTSFFSPPTDVTCPRFSRTIATFRAFVSGKRSMALPAMSSDRKVQWSRPL
jgi:hypothetical protein